MHYYTPVQLLDLILQILANLLRTGSKMGSDSALPLDIQQLVRFCFEGPMYTAKTSINRCQEAMQSLECDRRDLADKIRIQDHTVAQLNIQIKAHRIRQLSGFADRLDITLYEQLMEASQELKRLEIRSAEYGMAFGTIRHFLGLLMVQLNSSPMLTNGSDSNDLGTLAHLLPAPGGQVEELAEEEAQESISGEEVDARICDDDLPPPSGERKRRIHNIARLECDATNDDCMDVETGGYGLAQPPSKRICLRDDGTVM